MDPIAYLAAQHYVVSMVHMITRHDSHKVAFCVWYLFADWCCSVVLLVG